MLKMLILEIISIKKCFCSFRKICNPQKKTPYGVLCVCVCARTRARMCVSGEVCDVLT